MSREIEIIGRAQEIFNKYGSVDDPSHCPCCGEYTQGALCVYCVPSSVIAEDDKLTAELSELRAAKRAAGSE